MIRVGFQPVFVEEITETPIFRVSDLLADHEVSYQPATTLWCASDAVPGLPWARLEGGKLLQIRE